MVSNSSSTEKEPLFPKKVSLLCKKSELLIPPESDLPLKEEKREGREREERESGVVLAGVYVWKSCV